jgi:hypothetical protein
MRSPSLSRLATAIFATAVPLALAACAGELGDPARFEDPAECGLDVQEDILIPRCAVAGCHLSGDPVAGLEYLTGGLPDRLVDVEAAACPDRMLIDSADPDASFILVRTSETPMCGDEMLARMPFLRDPLSDYELACLRSWVHRVAEGADAE